MARYLSPSRSRDRANRRLDAPFGGLDAPSHDRTIRCPYGLHISAIRTLHQLIKHTVLYSVKPSLRLSTLTLEAGCLLATPTSSWQHHIEPQSAFPRQLLQITKIFSLRPPTFLSIKTNELTQRYKGLWTPL